MRPTENIWLTEYEGLLPTQPRDASVGDTASPHAQAPTPETTVRHPHLAMVQVEKTSPVAFFE